MKTTIEWRRVADELPPTDVRVLGAIYSCDFIVDEKSRNVGNVDVVYVDYDGDWCYDYGCVCRPQPTFWAYLPDAPRIEEVIECESC